MERLDDIRVKIARKQYEFSRHAVDRTIRRGIRVAEVEQAFRNDCEIVEDYPEDKYGPSLLVLGMTDGGRRRRVGRPARSRQLSQPPATEDHHLIRA